MNGRIERIRSTVKRDRSTLQMYLRRCILMVLVALVTVTMDPSGAGAVEPEIVARVNGEPVTRAEFQRMMADPLQQGQLQRELGAQVPDGKRSERLVLQKLIHQHLFLQEASRRNLTVTEKELDQAITGLRSRFQDLKSFGLWMEERGLDDRMLFDTVRAQVLMTKVWTALAEEVRITDEQVQAYYETHREELIIGEAVRLRIIVVKSSTEAEEIIAILSKGGNFSSLARERSLGLRAAQGGDTGWVDSRTLPPLLQKAVATLKAGEVYGPLEKTADEFFIVGLAGRRPLLANSPAEARSEIERRLLPELKQEAVQEWLEDQEEISEIEVFLQPEGLTLGKEMNRTGGKEHEKKI